MVKCNNNNNNTLKANPDENTLKANPDDNTLKANPNDNTFRGNLDDSTLKANPALCKHSTPTTAQIMHKSDNNAINNKDTSKMQYFSANA